MHTKLIDLLIAFIIELSQRIGFYVSLWAEVDDTDDTVYIR